MSFGKFDIHYNKANEAEKSGDFINAKRYFYLASRSLLEAALESDSDTETALIDRARIVEKYADALPLTESSVSSPKAPSASSSKKKSTPSSSAAEPHDDDDQEDDIVKFSPAAVPNISFDDVVGLEEVKDAIRRRFIYPMQHIDLYKDFKIKTGGGVLMYGLPGTGKTMIAKAIAHEVGAPFYHIRCSDILGSLYGEAEQNIRDLFDQLRSEEKAVVFFDEFDSLSPKRNEIKSSVMPRVVNELLSQIDGFNDRDNMLLFLAATNFPENIDSGITRSGRFSEKLEVPLPDPAAREDILRKNFSGAPIENDIDYKTLAIKTEGFSGGDLFEFCNTCKISVVVNRGIPNKVSGGNPEDVKITQTDIDKTLAGFSSTVTPEDIVRLEEFKAKYDKKKIANHSTEKMVPKNTQRPPYIVPVEGILECPAHAELAVLDQS